MPKKMVFLPRICLTSFYDPQYNQTAPLELKVNGLSSMIYEKFPVGMPEELHMNVFSATFAAKHRGLRHLLVLCLLVVGSAFYALGQSATIVGTVTDPSGSVVPNVAITVTNA